MLYRGTAALEVWARRSVAGKVEVANLAEDWRDGRWVSSQEQRFAVFTVSSRTEIFSFQSFLKEQRFSVFKSAMYSSRAFLALLHHHRPELVDLSRMEERDTITNCTEAFAIAEVSRDGGLV